MKMKATFANRRDKPKIKKRGFIECYFELLSKKDFKQTPFIEESDEFDKNKLYIINV